MRSHKNWKISYAEDALRDLNQIANYNEQTYGARHAEDYMWFLRAKISLISQNPLIGRILDSERSIRFIVIRRRPSAQGHIAVYRVQANAILIVHIFHTAQDWKSNFTDPDVG